MTDVSVVPLTAEEIASLHSRVTLKYGPTESMVQRLRAIAKEHERLVAVVAEYEHNICWDTTCSGCAAVRDKSYKAYCDERHDELVTERDALRAQLDGALRTGDRMRQRGDAIQRQLDDWRRDHAQVMSETCPSDEKHCACVPHLRAEIERLKGLVEA